MGQRKIFCFFPEKKFWNDFKFVEMLQNNTEFLYTLIQFLLMLTFYITIAHFLKQRTNIGILVLT